MKKSLKYLFLACVSAALFFGCKAQAGSGDDDKGSEVTITIPTSVQPDVASAPAFIDKTEQSFGTEDPVIKIEKETINSSLPDGETYVTSDGVLKITPRKDGLLIEKTHPDSWEHNTIHVFQVENGQENIRINNLDQNTNKVLYPFVKAGKKYRIHIEKQETNWQNWGETDRIEVEAIGGSGDFCISFNKYNYDPKEKTLAFEGLKFTYPDISSYGFKFSGPVFDGPVWGAGTKNTYPKYELVKSTVKISEDNSFLNNLNKVGISLVYEGWAKDSVAGKSVNYQCPVVSAVVYSSILKEDSLIVLTGGKEIPRVDITPTKGWYQGSSSYHFGSSWTEATMTITDTNGSVILDSASCKLKDRGNSTKWTGKVPWSVKLDEKASVLGMPKHKRWVLMANYFDRSLIRTQFASFMGNKVFNSYWNASFTPVNVYINNKFMGTYDLGECNKINKKRVNVQSIEDYATGASDYEDVNHDGKVNIQDAGFMVEIDTAINWGGTLTKENYKNTVAVDGNAAERIYFYSSEKCIPMTLKDPDFGDWGEFSEEKCREVGKYAKSKIDAFEKMLYSDDFKTKYTDYIDALSFIDWYLVNEFGKNSDANFQKSVPVTYNPATGLLYMGPNWDFDLSLGNFNHGYDSDFGNSTVDDPTGWYIYGGRKDCNENALYCEVNNTYQVQSWWINRLIESKAFKKAVKARWNDRKLYLKNGINQQILEYANRIYDYIPDNEANLPRLGVSEWNGPSGFEKRKTYEDEISYLYLWSIARYNWMDKEINKW